MKRLIYLLSFLFVSVSLGVVLGYKPNMNKVSASNVGDDPYRTYLISDVDQEYDSLEVSFYPNTYDSSSKPRYQMKKVNDYIFAVRVHTSVTDRYLKLFHNDTVVQTIDFNPSYATIGTTNQTGYISNTRGRSCKYLYPEYSTRRMWFEIDGLESDVFPTLKVDNNHRYVMNKIHNYIDDSDYYYVDVPVDTTSFGIDAINRQINSETSLLSVNSHSGVDSKQVMVCGVNKTITNIELNGCDQYMVNEYLRGFSTCLDNDINGYDGFTNYIKPFVDNFVSYDEGDLSSVYQDDYLSSDYDDGYKDGSVKEGNLVTALDKYLALQQYGESRGLRPFIMYETMSSTNIIVITSLSVTTLVVIVGYVLYKRHKVN